MPKRYWTPQGARVSTSLVSIEIFSEAEIVKLRRAGAIAAATLAYVGEKLRAGVTSADIDTWVRDDTKRRGAKPSQLGYHGFPHAVCVSRNQVVCHGMPSARERLEDGDIVNVDVTSHIDGFHGDCSATFTIGEVSPEAQRLVNAARRARDAGIAAVRAGAHLGDVGAAIAEFARGEGFSVVTNYGGHGIGRKMHADPHVPNVAAKGSGMRLRAGMAFTIEPMLNVGTAETTLLPDEWTVVTADGALSAQFEHTVVVTANGCEVTTSNSL
jgi:methionyl aminopeptidase